MLEIRRNTRGSYPDVFTTQALDGLHALAPLDDNRKALEAVIRYEFEQGMIKKEPAVEDLFFAPSLQRIQHYV